MVLVTGATGLVGGHLLVQLITQGVACRALRRHSSSLKELRLIASYYDLPFETLEEHVTWIEGDMTEVSALQEAIEGVERIYHCAALISFNSGKAEELIRVNVEGSRLICQTALENGVKEFIMVSSIAALGKSSDGAAIDEETPRDLTLDYNGYSQSKYASEQVVWEYAQQGLKVIVVNPGIILGVGLQHKSSLELVQKVRRGLPFYLTGVTGYVDVRDVARVMIRAAEVGVWGERFVLVAENLSYGTLFKAMARELHTLPPFIPLGRGVLTFAANLSLLYAKMAGVKPLFTPAMARSATGRSLYRSKKVERLLGITLTPISDTLREIGRWIDRM